MISFTESIELPCLRDVSNEELFHMIVEPGTAPNFSVHSQSVERAVKLTSKVVTKKCNRLIRNQMAHCIDKARSDRPYFTTKCNYQTSVRKIKKRNNNIMYAY